MTKRYEEKTKRNRQTDLANRWFGDIQLKVIWKHSAKNRYGEIQLKGQVEKVSSGRDWQRQIS